MYKCTINTMSEDNKYNIKVNRKTPSSEEIQKKMNFEGAYKAYTHKAYRTPWGRFQRHDPKNRKASMFIILAIVVGTLVFLDLGEKPTQQDDAPAVVPTQQQDSIQTPQKKTNN